MKLTFYATVFCLATFAGAIAEAASYTIENGCVSINVYVYDFKAAVDAGLYQWLEMQCVEVAS